MFFAPRTFKCYGYAAMTIDTWELNIICILFGNKGSHVYICFVLFAQELISMNSDGDTPYRRTVFLLWPELVFRVSPNAATPNQIVIEKLYDVLELWLPLSLTHIKCE